MTDLESTRTGWVIRWFGVFLIALAIGLMAWDVQAGDGIWPVNLVTFACGIWSIRTGTRAVRMAEEHHRFMEEHRAEMARLQTRWLS
jgi:hypothetical protein